MLEQIKEAVRKIATASYRQGWDDAYYYYLITSPEEQTVANCRVRQRWGEITAEREVKKVVGS